MFESCFHYYSVPSESSKTEIPEKPSAASTHPALEVNGDLVQIIATQDEKIQTFTVHKKRFMEASAFAAKKFGKNWGHFASARVELQHCPRAVGIFVEWLGTRRITLPEDFDNCWKVLFFTYVLGDFLIAPRFQNDVMSAIESSKKWPVNVMAIKIAYLNTPSGSKLRKFLVDMHIYEGQISMVDEIFACERIDADVRLDFACDILAELKELKHRKRIQIPKKWLETWAERFHIPDNNERGVFIRTTTAQTSSA